MTTLSRFGRIFLVGQSSSVSFPKNLFSTTSWSSIRSLSSVVASLDPHYSTPPRKFNFPTRSRIMSDDDSSSTLDIEEVHQAALQHGRTTYKDPETGFTVFTELSHLKRGTCCGNMCRHCPYGYENVKNPDWRRPAKLASGDRATADAMVQEILQNASSNNPTTTPNQESNPVGPTTQRIVSITSTATSGTTSKKADRLARAFSTTSKNVPYTRGGDGGTSQLGTGERRSKADDTFEALGTVDELCSVVGVVHAQLLPRDAVFGGLPDQLLDVMSRLFDVGSHIAKPREGGTVDFTANGIGDGFDSQHVQDLEDWINAMTEDLPELTSFILPTGAPAAAQLHVARTVCRRAERRLIPLAVHQQTCDPNALRYLNRLSDFFFVAARWVNLCEGQAEIQYRRDTPDTTQRERVRKSLQYDEEEDK